MTRKIRPVLIAATCAAVALPASATATISAIKLTPQFGSLGCIDVTVGSTALEGSFKLNGSTVGALPGIVLRPALNCGGGVGRSFTFDTISGGPETLDLELRVNDEATPTTIHIPPARRNGTFIHFRELPAGAVVNGVAATGPAFDLTPIPGADFPVTSTANGHPVTMQYSPGNVAQSYFYVNTHAKGTSVQLNDFMPNVDVTVKMLRADNSELFSRTVSPQTFITGGPPLAPGQQVQVVQSGIFDRTRPIGTAELRSDGFRVALPPGASDGRYSFNLALHAASTSSVDPIGPCDTLHVAGPLPSECAPLVAPRVEVIATGLLPVAGDGVEMQSNFTGTGDYTSIRVEQPGVYFEPASGEVYSLGITGGPLVGSLTVPRPAPAGPLTLARTGLAPGGGGEGSEVRYPFAAKILPDSSVTFSGGSQPLQAALTLEAAVEGTAVKGRTRPGSRVRVRVRYSFYTTVDLAVAAAADGTFSVPIGTPPTGARIEVSAGDPTTRSHAFRLLLVGRSPSQIGGAVDQQLVRGAVNLSASNPGLAVGWSVAEQADPRSPGAALALNTALRPDGPLRVDVADSFNVEDYLYLVVDNTAPSGGAGADQRVRVGRDAAIVTSAADANGIARVQVAFGDGANVTQTGAGIGAPLLHRYRRAGRFTARATITDNAGNVTVDESVITVTAAPVLRLTGKLPTSVRRGKVLKISQLTSVAGTLRVQLLAPTGKAVRKGAATTSRANGRATVNLKSKGLKRGRYLLVRQLVGADGEAGPVLVTSVRVR